MRAQSRRSLSALIVPAALFALVVRTGAQTPPASASTGAADAATREGISGAWQLNHDLTDHATPTGTPGGAPDSGRWGSGGGGGRGGGHGGGRGGFGGRGGGMGGARGGTGGASDEDRQRRMDTFRELMRPPERLTIVKMENRVAITDADGRSIEMTLDNKKEKHVVGSEMLEMKARWEGSQLLIETDLGEGRKVLHTYSTVSDAPAPQLQVLVKVEGGRQGQGQRQPLEMRRVYDPVK